MVANLMEFISQLSTHHISKTPVKFGDEVEAYSRKSSSTKKMILGHTFYQKTT